MLGGNPSVPLSSCQERVKVLITSKERISNSYTMGLNPFS